MKSKPKVPTNLLGEMMPEFTELREDYTSLEFRVRSLEKIVNKLTKHNHTITVDDFQTDEVII
jgi:hypothetical protein